MRHLVLAGDIAGTDDVLAWIASELSRATYINLMAQYHPCYRADEHPPLDRRPSGPKYRRALEVASSLGLARLDR